MDRSTLVVYSELLSLYSLSSLQQSRSIGKGRAIVLREGRKSKQGPKGRRISRARMGSTEFSQDSCKNPATASNCPISLTNTCYHVYPSPFSLFPPLSAPTPLSLSRFCLHLHNLLEDPTHRNSRIFLYSSDEPDKKVNAALLMSLYAVSLSSLSHLCIVPLLMVWGLDWGGKSE